MIEKFIRENLPHIEDTDDIPEAFDEFWNTERLQALQNISTDEALDIERLEEVIGDYLFTEKKPLRDNVIDMMHERPKLKERATTAERITHKIFSFVETFVNGVSG